MTSPHAVARLDVPPAPALEYQLAPATTAAPLPLPFHRLGLLAQPKRWGRPLAVLGVAVGLYLALAIVTVIGSVVYLFATTGSWEAMDEAAMMDMSQPVTFAFTMLSIAVMLPAVLLAVRIVGRRRVGTTMSVVGQLRWGLLGQSMLATLACFAVLMVITFVMDPVAPHLKGDVRGALIMAGLAVLVVPFQAAAEEFAFRALPMQVMGAWLRHPIWGILLPVPLFVWGHSYSVQGQLEIALFAVIAGYLTWRTGGLEAAIGLHVVNNLGLSLIATVGLADMNATEVTWATAGLSAGYTLAAAGLIVMVVRRREARGEVVRVGVGR